MAYPEDAHVLAIWLRLQAWSPDLAGAAFPFSARLAAENGWSAAHTQRVIQEYRRFALLAVISPQTMTPSDAVDQAWHLHLTCTRAYWEDFCPRVLGAPLHHEPTRGGPREDARYRQTYEATLRRYREVFGMAPPGDLWPDPDQRFAVRQIRVDRRRHWVLPQPMTLAARAVATGRPAVMAVVAASLVVAGCVGVFDDHIASSPSAAAFLNFYLLLCVLAFALALHLRRQSLTPDGDATGLLTRQPDLYELAWLARGDEGVLQTVVAGLYQSGAITLGARKGTFALATALDARAHAVEHAFAADLKDGVLPVGGGRALRGAMAALRASLQGRGLTPADGSLRTVTRNTLRILGGVLAVGALRVAYGLGRHHPVGFLLAMMLLMVLAMVPLALLRPRANAAGRRAVALARASWQAGGSIRAADARLPLAMALFGTAVLSDPAFAALRASVAAITPTGGVGGGDTSSSGCGGGGCGGGGCGG
ncbi:MAG: TIGR04222 domain-containing membrane protein [Pseudomonadota bacterium]|nr:TIGR04222 domain-containing membrane protein [Pseudomonadota bacterium]